jgi:hypothetical protein
MCSGYLARVACSVKMNDKVFILPTVSLLGIFAVELQVSWLARWMGVATCE